MLSIAVMLILCGLQFNCSRELNPGRDKGLFHTNILPAWNVHGKDTIVFISGTHVMPRSYTKSCCQAQVWKLKIDLCQMTNEVSVIAEKEVKVHYTKVVFLKP